MSEMCSAKTKQGKPCRAPTVVGSPFCAMHGNPSRAAELGRMGGRKNRHYVETAETPIPVPKTPEDVKNMLAQGAADVIRGKLDTRKASTLTYMASALLKAMESTDVQQFDPLLAPLGGSNKRLLLAPDGDLSRLPFEVLPTNDGRRLIDDYCISYLAAGRDVLRFRGEQSRRPTEPLVVADPDFNLVGKAVVFANHNSALPLLTVLRYEPRIAQASYFAQ